jgi:hypothetical protein
MRFTLDVRVDQRPVQKARRALPVLASRFVMAWAFTVQGVARSVAPVDFGFLKNSIQAVAFGQAMPSPQTGARGQQWGQLPKPPAPFEALVLVGADYGFFVEFGTRYAPGQLYLTAGLLSARVQAPAIWRGIVSQARREGLL